MKRDKTKHDDLLNDILSPGDLDRLESDSLQSALGAARQRRSKRRAVKVVLGLLAPVSLATLLFVRGPSDENTAENSKPAAPDPVQADIGPSPSLEVEVAVDYISDEELLAIFPGRPVALVGQPGSQRLIFLDDIENSPATASFPP